MRTLAALLATALIAAALLLPGAAAIATLTDGRWVVHDLGPTPTVTSTDWSEPWVDCWEDVSMYGTRYSYCERRMR